LCAKISKEYIFIKKYYNELISLPHNLLQLPKLNKLFISKKELDLIEKTFDRYSNKIFISTLDL
jgi:hypothetical protein